MQVAAVPGPQWQIRWRCGTVFCFSDKKVACVFLYFLHIEYQNVHYPSKHFGWSSSLKNCLRVRGWGIISMKVLSNWDILYYVGSLRGLSVSKYDDSVNVTKLQPKCRYKSTGKHEEVAPLVTVMKLGLTVFGKEDGVIVPRNPPTPLGVSLIVSI